jgi:lysine 2,3-aminomutase
LDNDPFPSFSSVKSTPQWHDWHWQLKNSVTQFSHAELAGEQKLPFRITPYYADLLSRLGPGHPLARTMLPSPEELLVSPGEAQDPLGEDASSPVPGLVHRYPDRALLLATNTCAAYCRYCTRSRAVGHGHGTEDFNRPAINYLWEHKEIRDVIISGGDPLTMSTQRIETLLHELNLIPHLEMIRLGTKVPVVLPQRIDSDLLAVLARYHPWISIHFTHPDEVTPEVSAACNALASAGCPLGSQTVLLKGINDDVEVIRELMVKLLKIRVRPYYLYQCDPILGSKQFRTDPATGVKIIKYLRGRISGYGVPTFVIDAPGGGGKIPLAPNYCLYRSESEIRLENWAGKRFSYPL